MHANSAIEVPARIEALGVAAGVDRAAVHSQLAAAVDVVVHVIRDRDGCRRLAQLCVLEQASDGLVSAREAVRFEGDDIVEGPGSAVLEALLADRLRAQP